MGQSCYVAFIYQQGMVTEAGRHVGPIVGLAEGRLSVSVMFAAIDVALPPPVMLPIELMLSSIVMVILSCANAAGDAIPTTRETAATILTTAIKFSLYMQPTVVFCCYIRPKSVS